MAQLRLKNGKTISDFGKPYIVAELGANHNGDMKLAEQMIRRAKEAGCDCVKFQSWSKNTIFSKKVYEDDILSRADCQSNMEDTLEAQVEKFSISEAQLLDMKRICDEIKIDCTSSPFSKQEVDFLVEALEVPFIKVASMDLNNYSFLEYIAQKGKPIVLATGMGDFYEVDRAVRTIEQAGNNDICILHCIANYPPQMEDINLNNIHTLRSMYPSHPIGFSDHTLGTAISLASVALGAGLIEKHFTLDKNMSGWDHKVSADFDDMQVIVRESEQIYKALGNTRRVVGEAELQKRKAFRRSIVAARDISEGETITMEMLDTKRPGTGIAPESIELIVGKTAKRDIAFDKMLEAEDF